MAFDSLQQCFRTVDIDAVLTMEPPPPIWKQPVYIIIDPAAGGPQSDFALVSITRFKGIVTVSSRRDVRGLHVALEVLHSEHLRNRFARAHAECVERLRGVT